MLKQSLDKNLSSTMSRFYVYEYYLLESGQVFYIGKGTGRRAKVGRRNADCERIKRQNETGWDVRIVQTGLTEQQAGDLEVERIGHYRDAGHPITNVKPGGLGDRIDADDVAVAKYLLFLVKHKVLRMTQQEISDRTGVYPSLTSYLSNSDSFDDAPYKIPYDISEIIAEFHLNKYSDVEQRVGHVKYVLELMEKGVIKLTQKQLAGRFGMTEANLSMIKLKKSHSDIPAMVPPNIGELLRDYDASRISEAERKFGELLFVLRLVEEGVLRVPSRDLAEVLNVSEHQVADVKRNRYEYAEVRPLPETFYKLGPYFAVKKETVNIQAPELAAVTEQM